MFVGDDVNGEQGQLPTIVTNGLVFARVPVSRRLFGRLPALGPRRNEPRLSPKPTEPGVVPALQLYGRTPDQNRDEEENDGESSHTRDGSTLRGAVSRH